MLTLGKEFLDITPKANLQKEKKMYTVHFLKVKNFCSVKDNVKDMRRQATDSEKIFEKDTSSKVQLIQNIQRTLKTQQYENNPIEKWARDILILSDISPKKLSDQSLSRVQLFATP